MAHKNKQNISPYTQRREGLSSGQRGKHKMPEQAFSFNEADDRIFDVFRNHDFADYPHEKRQKLTAFYQILMDQQRKLNITRLHSIKDVALKHFIDCLMVPRLCTLKFPLIDVGTGPGFPGIPLRIDQPEGTILLAEGVQKRVDYLKEVREKLELPDVKIIGRNIDSDFEYPVQTAITRAVEDIGNTLGNVRNCVATGGRVIFMKGPQVDPELKPAIQEWKDVYQFVDDISYSLPNSPHQRRLVIFEKKPSKAEH